MPPISRQNSSSTGPRRSILLQPLPSPTLAAGAWPGATRTQTATTRQNATIRSRPGKMPAMNSAPIEVSVRKP